MLPMCCLLEVASSLWKRVVLRKELTADEATACVPRPAHDAAFSDRE